MLWEPTTLEIKLVLVRAAEEIELIAAYIRQPLDCLKSNQEKNHWLERNSVLSPQGQNSNYKASKDIMPFTFKLIVLRTIKRLKISQVHWANNITVKYIKGILKDLWHLFSNNLWNFATAVNKPSRDKKWKHKIKLLPKWLNSSKYVQF